MSSCAVLFDFSFCCGVRLTFYWKISFSTNDFSVNVADPNTWVSCHFSFIVLFVGVLLFYAINLNNVSLFINSTFTFLVLNHKLYQFELLNIVLFSLKKISFFYFFFWPYCLCFVKKFILLNFKHYFCFYQLIVLLILSQFLFVFLKFL